MGPGMFDGMDFVILTLMKVMFAGVGLAIYAASALLFGDGQIGWGWTLGSAAAGWVVGTLFVMSLE